MGPLLFTYPITGTPWLIVISKGAEHFYFDTTTKQSVWQFGETGVDSLEKRVNFDDLAVLFGKSNGLKVAAREPKRPKVDKPTAGRGSVHDALDEVVADPEIQKVVDTFVADHAEVSSEGEPDTQADAGEPNAETDSEATEIKGPNAADQPPGLNLGYSSDSDEDEEGHEESESEGEPDINAGLDLGFESEEDPSSAQADFLELLDQHKDKISVNDPWFLVEEELLPQFASSPAYYAISDPNAKERLFEKWAAKATAGQGLASSSEGPYPTATLKYFRFLQEHKAEVRKLFFAEFCSRHKQEHDQAVGVSGDIDPEMLYRKLRLTLNDFADFERKNKKGFPGNIKVHHVSQFVADKLQTLKPNPEAPSSEPEGHFDRWMALCNHHRIPQNVVEDPRNFILGDEKRLACYSEKLASRS